MSRRTRVPEKNITEKDVGGLSFLYEKKEVAAEHDKTANFIAPKYVNLQRQKALLQKRLSVPPAINQFKTTLPKDVTKKLFSLLERYRPPTKADKKTDRAKEAQKNARKTVSMRVDSKSAKAGRALAVGVKSVTSAVEMKSPRLVVIANDVEPIEHVIWLPTLCHKLEVPYCIVKGRSRLGELVGLKNCSCVAIIEAEPEDRNAVQKIVDEANSIFNSRFKEAMTRYGGGELSEKTKEKLKAQGRAVRAGN